MHKSNVGIVVSTIGAVRRRHVKQLIRDQHTVQTDVDECRRSQDANTIVVRIVVLLESVQIIHQPERLNVFINTHCPEPNCLFS